MAKKRMYIVDGAGFYYRAFYGIRSSLRAPDGTPTNAVYGFARMFLKIIRDDKPDYIGIAMDSKEKTFRHDMYPQYKATREKMPEDLSAQIPIIERVIKAFNIPILKRPGYEADDLIGCAAVKGAKKGFEVVLVSGDKDLMQLVNDNVKMFDPLKEKLIDAEGVKEKFGVGPEGVVDMLGLMGDSSDNIPGVPGIGKKTAFKLLEKYGDMENILKHAGEVKRPKLRESLLEYAEQARLSRELARIKTELDLEIDFDSWKLTEPDRRELNDLFSKLGFKSLIEDRAPVKQERGDYKTVLSEGDFKKLLKKLKDSKEFAVDTETTSREPMRAELVGLSFSTKEGEGYYIPVAHDYDGAPAQLSKKEVIKALKPVLEDPKIKKYGQNIKYDFIVLSKEGINLYPLSFDTMIASYLLNAEERRHNLSLLAERYLNYSMIEYADVAGKGVKEISFSKVEMENAAEYAAEDADITFRLTGILKRKIKEEGFEKLYYGLELPLVKILAEMEKIGIAINAKKLEKYSRELEGKLRELEEEIYVTAGERFNVASPKQLSEILFDKLGLRKVKKIKTGASSDQQVLEALSGSHPLPALVLIHRRLSKLRSTYVDPLPRMVLKSTGRIHTSYNQAMAATGRLSSSSPNLQNIPVRTEEGRKIREAFHAEKGYVLVSADYSQIELRLFAHLSGDKLLTDAFKKDEDIHARTANEIFGPLAGKSSDMRRIAKAVNFSIIYGKTAFGLSRDLQIPWREAASYIENYFNRYRGVHEYIKSVKESARKNGYVATMAGRKRYLPNINSSNRTMREMAERMAVNTVAQGSAADIIKKAMIDVDRALAGSGARMLLQVHDELIFEVPEKKREKISKIILTAMEKAEKLSVPLKVQVSFAFNWGELH